MSTKATKSSRLVNQALSASKRDAAQAKLAHETSRLAKDADLTVKVIETIDRFHMKLPPLPKALKLEPPPQQQATRKKR